MERYIFIYSIGSGIIENIPGALSKAVGGKSSCALCNITHGPLFEKQSWKTFIQSLAVPIDLYHINEIPQSIREYLDTCVIKLPVVLKQTTDNAFEAFVSKEQLEKCEGSAECLKDFFHKN